MLDCHFSNGKRSFRVFSRLYIVWFRFMVPANVINGSKITLLSETRLEWWTVRSALLVGIQVHLWYLQILRLQKVCFKFTTIITHICSKSEKILTAYLKFISSLLSTLLTGRAVAVHTVGNSSHGLR